MQPNRYEVIDLTNVPEPPLDSRSSVEDLSFRHSSRLSLEFSSTKAPMNPEELRFLREGHEMMQRAKEEAFQYKNYKTQQQQRNFAPKNKKKSSFFSFGRPRKE